jgi:hypothetical protein
MEDYEEDEELFDSDSGDDDLSFDEAEEDDDPKGDAFLRGVEEAVKIRDEPKEEEEEEQS